MKSVTYIRGRAKFRRVLRPSDLDRLGVPHKDEDLVFSPENKFTIVMNNKMSDSLVAAFPDDFKAYSVDGDDEEPEIEVKEPLTSLTASSAQDPDESADDSEESGDDDVKSSKRQTPKNQ